jgi:hypothetical protein
MAGLTDFYVRISVNRMNFQGLRLVQVVSFVSLFFSFVLFAQPADNSIELASKPSEADEVQGRSVKNPISPLKLNDVSARVAVKHYQQLTGRTVIFGPLSNLNQRVTAHFKEASTPAEQAQAIKAILATNEIILKDAGERFVFVMSPLQTNDLPEILELSKHSPEAQKRDIHLRYEYAPSEWIFRHYSELTGLKWNKNSVRADFMSIETGQPISKPEAIAALEALVALHNLRIDHLGKDSFEVVERARKKK